MELITFLLTALILAGVAGYTVVTSRRQNALIVALDLLDSSETERPAEFDQDTTTITPRTEYYQRYAEAGIDQAEERRRFIRCQRLSAPIGLAIGTTAVLLFGPTSPANLLVGAAAGLALGYLQGQGSLRRRRRKYLRDLEYFLPIVMERLVMAVQAGLEVLAAIQTLTQLQADPKEQSRDPVTKLLAQALRLTEAGLSFEAALRQVAQPVHSPAVKHALIHLALAQKEGGELTAPLRELSDATLQYYKDRVEEEIAKLPVKATLPLVCVFTGLIIIFITPPLLQIMDLAGKAGG